MSFFLHVVVTHEQGRVWYRKEIVVNSLKIYKRNVPVILWAIGIYVFPFILRNRLISSISAVNIIVYFGLFYGYITKVMRSPFSKMKEGIFSRAFVLVGMFSSTILLFIVPGNEWGLLWKCKMFFVYVLPMLYMTLRINRIDSMQEYSAIWVKWLRTICVVMIVFKILDIGLGDFLQRFWVTLYQSSTLEYLVNKGRFVSFYGHSLENTLFFLLLIVWANIYHNATKSNKDGLYLIDTMTGLIGIAISGSKSGLMLAILLLLLCNIGLKKTKYMIGVLVIFAMLYFTGILDTVLNRIMEGIAIGDLSTSRNTALERLLLNGTLSFESMRGHAIDYSSTSIIAALEYPFLRWSYTNGIVFTVIMYCVYFVFPVMKILKTKKWNALICVLILMAYVNGNNGISAYNDDLLIYAINIGLIIQTVVYMGEKNEYK